MKHNVLFYRGSGKVGNLVGYSTLGKQVFRAYQPEVQNPKTTAQENQRKKFNVMLEAARMFRPAYLLGMKDEGRANKRTAFAQFMSINFPFVVGESPSQYHLNPPAAICAQGNLPGVDVEFAAQVPAGAEEAMRVLDYHASDTGALASDDMYVIVVNFEKSQVSMSGPTKRDGSSRIEVKIPAAWDGDEVHFYSFVAGTAGDNLGKSSVSTWMGAAHVGQ